MKNQLISLLISQMMSRLTCLPVSKLIIQMMNQLICLPVSQLINQMMSQLICLPVSKLIIWYNYIKKRKCYLDLGEEEYFENDHTRRYHNQVPSLIFLFSWNMYIVIFGSSFSYLIWNCTVLHSDNKKIIKS